MCRRHRPSTDSLEVCYGSLLLILTRVRSIQVVGLAVDILRVLVEYCAAPSARHSCVWQGLHA